MNVSTSSIFKSLSNINKSKADILVDFSDDLVRDLGPETSVDVLIEKAKDFIQSSQIKAAMTGIEDEISKTKTKSLRPEESNINFKVRVVAGAIMRHLNALDQKMPQEDGAREKFQAEVFASKEMQEITQFMWEAEDEFQFGLEGQEHLLLPRPDEVYEAPQDMDETLEGDLDTPERSQLTV